MLPEFIRNRQAARAHDGCLPARLGVKDRLVLAGTEIGLMIRASSAILSKGSRKGQLETCMKSSVAERQFHIEWDSMLRFCKTLPWALRIRCLGDQNPCQSDIFLHSELLEPC